MKVKQQVVFDIGADKFKYLHRDGEENPKRVDMTELNKRLNRTKKMNFYNNTKIITISVICLVFFLLISLSS